ncbi:MAG: ABC transporter ATP-binding protein, partial [Novosphingobium sp.]
IYDMLPPERLDRVLQALRQYGTTVLQFTGRPEGLGRDMWLWIGTSQQRQGSSPQAVVPVREEDV